MITVVFLGTNGWYDTPTGNTVSILLDTPEATILLDAGNGLAKADRYADPHKPAVLFLSHLHLDHVIGLHALNKLRFERGLTILTQPGTKGALEALIGPPYSLAFSRLPYPVQVREFAGAYAGHGVALESLPMRHSDPTIGFRLAVEGKTVAYCPDTGYCEAAVRLARNADLLIAECAFRSGEESEGWPHLNPETAAGIAVEAGAEKLVLVHFDAFRYPDIPSRMAAQAAARTVFANAHAAVDELVLEV